jgi:hypothetical protein
MATISGFHGQRLSQIQKSTRANLYSCELRQVVENKRPFSAAVHSRNLQNTFRLVPIASKSAWIVTRVLLMGRSGVRLRPELKHPGQ